MIDSMTIAIKGPMRNRDEAGVYVSFYLGRENRQSCSVSDYHSDSFRLSKRDLIRFRDEINIMIEAMEDSE